MAQEATEKKSFVDAMMPFVYKVAGPLTKFGQFDFVKAITNGMVGTIGITMIGSLALVMFLLAADGQLTEHALLPFLAPYAGKILLIQQLSLGILAPYLAISLGSEYAQVKGISNTTGAIGTFFAFIMLNFNAIAATEEGIGALTINNWGSGGIITAMLAAAIAINIIHFCYEKNIKITLPDSVPPAIGGSFSAVIPYALIGILCWVIRTILDFDVATWVTTILMPILSGADNIGMYTLSQALTAILWAVGLHGDNIVGAVTGTFLPAWDLQNVEWLVSGGAISAAPHVWTQGLSRLSMWTCSAWPLLILMMKDSKKLPQFKALAAVAFPPAIFSIVEPIIFGLPIMLNPYLIIPFVVSHTLSAILTYAATAAGFVGKLCVSLPWATPAPLLGFAGGGGSIGGLVWPFLMCAMGLVIFWPFWNAYVEDELKKAEAAEADAA